MFAATNRAINKQGNGWERFGEVPNARGPNELRVLRATQDSVHLLPDQLRLEGRSVPASAWAAHRLARRIRGRPRPIVLFVHGFNTTLREALDRAARLETQYNIEVVPFCWPSNGGGARGVASYKSDKRDALASVGALARFFEIALERLRDHARPECKISFTLLAHSMGAHLVEQLVRSPLFEPGRLLFESVLFVAADVNSAGHAEWMDRIPFRRRLYVTINENDAALAASRAKGGVDQLARLGHWPYDLAGKRVTYVDFTHAAGIGRSHAYFEGEPLKNPAVCEFFRAALRGLSAEDALKWDARRGVFDVL